MAESTYESRVCSIPCDAHTVYSVLSNFKNLDRVRDLLPADKVQELEVTEDCIRLKVNGLGQKIALRIIDRKPDDTLKIEAENSPVPFTFWMQLKQLHSLDTRIKLTLKADIPFMFRMMLGNKLQQGLDDAAQMLTQFPYTAWTNQN